MDIKTFDDLRRKIGSIMGVSIPKGQFERVVLERDTQGVFAHKQVIRVIIAMYNYLEANEAKVEAPPAPTPDPVIADVEDPAVAPEPTPEPLPEPEPTPEPEPEPAPTQPDDNGTVQENKDIQPSE